MIDQYLSSFDYSSSTRERYRSILERFVLEVQDLEALQAGELLSWLRGQRWGPSSQSVGLYAIKGFLRWRFGSNHPALTARIKRRRSPEQRSLSGEQVLELLSCFDTSSIKGRRDLAMAALFLDSGLRVSELARLEIRYLDLDHGRLQVIIKGGDWGSGVYSQYTAALIGSWLADRDLIAAPGISQVFVSVKRGQGLTRAGIGRIVSKWGQISGLGALSPHDLRRSFATLATRRGVPARVLMEAGRWRSPAMIERYTQAISQEDFRDYFPIPGIMGIE